jgi:hypothetical protein
MLRHTQEYACDFRNGRGCDEFLISCWAMPVRLCPGSSWQR